VRTLPFAVLAKQDAALILGAPRDLAHCRCARHAKARRREITRAAGEHEQRFAHELVERDHHRDRIARQAEEERVADPAERHRPPGTHRDLPEQHFAELAHQAPHEIGFADRHAARRDDRIRAERSAAQRVLELRGIVAHDAEVEQLDAQARQHAAQRVAIRVVDLALGKRRPDRRKLVAGREENDAQAAPDADARHAKRADHAQLGRPDERASFEHRDSGPQVFAGIAHVLLRLLARRDRDPLAVDAHDFLDHDRIGAGREARRPSSPRTHCPAPTLPW
jgi:hypothetical protein